MYKVVTNTNKVYTSTGGREVTVPKQSNYSVHWVKGGNSVHVLDIKDHLSNPKGVGEGICRLLNKGDVVLDLM